MKKQLTFWLSVSLVVFYLILSNSATVFAVPAYPHPFLYTQPDGTKLTITLKGDEKVHWAVTTDNYTLLQNGKGGFSYAFLNENGDLTSSGILANEPKNRTASELDFLRNVEKGLSFSKSQSEILKSLWEVKTKGQDKAFPTTGTRNLVCLLIGFTDKAFTKTKAEIDSLYNQVGYNLNGATGSVKDFFYESSYSQLTLNITVAGPYTAANNMAYYGGNDTNGDDLRPRELVTEAINFADPTVNYANFDNDGDGTVDGVYMIYAGYGEEAGGGVNCIWAHAWSLASPLTKDGKTISKYSCSSELRGSSGTNLTRIGVICHEFGHVLGAPDFYDTNYNNTGDGQYDGTGDWDLQAGGSWNGSAGDGATPAQPNPYTKIYIYNWATATTISTGQDITLQNAEQYSNSFYRVNTATTNEYYLLENRQQHKFDTYIPGHGMLIYHVHSAIGTSSINITAPQKMYPVCANATTNPGSTPSTYGTINGAGCPFPGSGNKTSFTDATTPWAKSWAGANTAKPIESITENTTAKTISFKFMGGFADVNDPTVFLATPASSSQIDLSWTKNASNNNVLLIYNTTGTFGTPVNGTVYNAGQTITGGGTVLYNGSVSSYNHVSLSSNTTYYYKTFSVLTGNSYSTGVTQNATTLCNSISTLPFTEGFSGTSLPSCWSIKDNQGSGEVWQFGTTSGSYPGLTGATGNYAYINSDALGSGHSQNADLITPTLDLTAYTVINLSFKHYFKSYTGSSATLSYSINNGSTWTQLQQWTSTSATNPELYNQDLSTQLAGKSQVKLKWNYIGSYAYGWSIDDISITVPAPPTATTTAASNITSTTATLNGTVNANNASTTVTFEYGLTTSYGSTANASQSPVTGLTNTSVSAAITGLTSGTTYHYRVKAVSTIGTTYGTDISFTTATPLAPTATTNAASNIAITTSTLNGTVNANNASTTVTFEYGLTTSYGSTATASQSPVTGSTNTSVSAAISGLTANTTYHFRVKAVNSVNTTYGSDMSFTTLATPACSTLPLSEDFEGTVFPPTNWDTLTIANVGSYGKPTWSSVTSGSSPTCSPQNGTKMVKFNSFNCDDGDESRLIASCLNLTGKTSVTLNFYMYHDNGYTSKTGEGIQVQYSLNGTTWTDIGTLTARYATTNAWTQHAVSLNSLAGQSYVLIGFKAHSQYGNNMYLDNILISEPPTATTVAANNIAVSSATLNGTVNANNSSTTVTFEYGLTTSYGSSATATQSPVTGSTNTSVTANISSLVANTIYHYRVKAVNIGGTTYGSDLTFTTLAPAPTATTVAASSITSSGATVNGTVNANNTATSVTFEYGLTTSYGSTATATQSPVTGTSNTNVSIALSSLTANTTYHFRVKAVNTGGTTYGSDLTFTTLAPAPTATTVAASSITLSGATVNGTVNANNASTTVTFEYGLTTSYGSTATATQSPVSGTSNTAVSASLSSLTSNTVYHFRVKAVSAGGTTYGTDLSFTTSAQLPTAASVAASSITSTAATLNGTVNANNASTTVTFEYGLTSSYGSTVSASQSPVTGSTNTTVNTNISGLISNTTYHFRVKAVNAGGTVYGDDLSFSTSASLPTATTDAASNLTSTGATLNGTVNANNSTTSVTFEYGLTTSYGNTVTPVQSPVTGATNTSVSYILSGLSINTTYHYRVVAVNSAGTSNGTDLTFTTSAVAPIASTNAASNITSISALLNGIVNPQNASTTVTFEYGLTTSYGSTATASQSPVTGISNTNVSAAVSGLTANTTYHFRIKANNLGGTTYGDDMSFTTLSTPICGVLPFSESFEGTTFLPAGWDTVTVVNNGSSGKPTWSRVTNGTYPTCTPQNGSQMIKFNSYNCDNGDESRIIVKCLDLTGKANVSLSYFMYHDNGYSSKTNEGVQVQYSLDGTTWNNIGALVARYSSTNAWSNHTLNLNVVGNQSYVLISFKAYSQYGNNIYIDNILIDETPSAPTATNNPATNITISSATLNATVNANNSYTTVEFEYGTTTSYGGIITAIQSPITGSTNTAVSANLAGLSNNTIYHYRVKATNLGGTTYGTDLSFSTLSCSVINTFPYNEGFESGVIPSCYSKEFVTGTKDWSIAKGNGSSNPANAHSGVKNLVFKNATTTADVTKLILTQMDISALAKPQLKFWHTQPVWSSDQDQLNVYYKNSSSGTWTLLNTYTNSITSWTQEIINLPNKSNDYYIAFEGTAKYGYGICIDDISVANSDIVFSTNTTISESTTFENVTVSPNITLNISDGVTLNVSSNLLLESDATGTGALVINGTGLVNVTGNSIIKRHLATNAGYRYFSSPYAAGSSVYANNFNANEIYSYNETNNSWINESANSTIPGKGYAANFLANPSIVNLSAQNFYNGDLTLSALTKSDATNSSFAGYHLVGNPYPSPIDWDAASGWTKTNIENSIYFFNATGHYSGIYSSYVSGVGGTNGGTQYIPSLQAFFVKLSADNGTLNFTNSVRVYSDQTFHKTADNTNIRLKASLVGDNNLPDELIISFNKQATSNYDSRFDAIKMMNNDISVPNIYCLGEQNNYSINSLPIPSGNEVIIPLGFNIQSDGNYKIEISNLNNIPQGWSAYLVDLQNNNVIELSINSEYLFSANVNDATERFLIKLVNKAYKINENSDNYINVFNINNYLHVSYYGESEAKLNISNVIGQNILNTNINKGNYTFNINSSNTYIITITDKKSTYNKKIFIK